jgi:ketol-acid reductoisomerase
MTRSLRVDREAIRKHLQEVMREITSGDFAREWAAEQSGGAENFDKMRALGRRHNPFTPIEQRLRELMGKAQAKNAPDR